LVVLDGDYAWVFWDPGAEQVLRAVLPMQGVRLFERRDAAWYRPGRRIPSVGVPTVEEAVSLARAITPEPFVVEAAGGGAHRPARLRLARDTRSRPTSAALCPLDELGRWADSATSAELEAIRGAISGGSALFLGRSLPFLPGAERYWGRRVLVPIGFEPRPALPEEALCEALGASAGEVLRLVPGPEGPSAEAIPIEAFRPLTRAGVRLALAESRPS